MRHKLSCARAGAGFTLIELMVTIAVLAVIMAIAVPSFTRQIQSGRAEMAADGLKRAVASARALASQTGRRTTLTINGVVTDCGDKAAWAITQGGALVSCVSTTDFSKRYEGATLDSTASVTLVFGPSGLSAGLSGAAGNLDSVTYRFVSGSVRKAVTIDAGGVVGVSDA
ncbi:Tfp pilus assembly protein FimT/FimU [Uliginosibacterium paludis]|uniref:GspH/FimT family pseudopilin n=1 Tax=Uliginosibacterium paludis TaxID=1615952 RepID=A0ABV2CRP2_9RHOO